MTTAAEGEVRPCYICRAIPGEVGYEEEEAGGFWTCPECSSAGHWTCTFRDLVTRHDSAIGDGADDQWHRATCLFGHTLESDGITYRLKHRTTCGPRIRLVPMHTPRRIYHRWFVFLAGMIVLYYVSHVGAMVVANLAVALAERLATPWVSFFASDFSVRYPLRAIRLDTDPWPEYPIPRDATMADMEDLTKVGCLLPDSLGLQIARFECFFRGAREWLCDSTVPPSQNTLCGYRETLVTWAILRPTIDACVFFLVVVWAGLQCINLIGVELLDSRLLYSCRRRQRVLELRQAGDDICRVVLGPTE